MRRCAREKGFECKMNDLLKPCAFAGWADKGPPRHSNATYVQRASFCGLAGRPKVGITSCLDGPHTVQLAFGAVSSSLAIDQCTGMHSQIHQWLCRCGGAPTWPSEGPAPATKGSQVADDVNDCSLTGPRTETVSLIDSNAWINCLIQYQKAISYVPVVTRRTLLVRFSVQKLILMSMRPQTQENPMPYDLCRLCRG